MIRSLSERGRALDIQDLYKHYIHDVYRYLLSLCKDKALAEDLTQDTFMKAYSSLANNPPNYLKAWLLKIAYHTFIDYVRRNKKVIYEEPDYFSVIESSESAELDFLKKAEKEELLTNIKQLKPMQRNAIALCDLQGYSHKDAAAILLIKVNTLKSHIFRGRSQLKKMYERSGVDE